MLVRNNTQQSFSLNVEASSHVVADVIARVWTNLTMAIAATIIFPFAPKTIYLTS